jgi:dTDP-4-dehydrorhamnose reductase
MKILLFGSSGTLGLDLQKLNADIICPTHNECNIADMNTVGNLIYIHKPDIVINAAAIIDNRAIEADPEDAIYVNIIGAANVSRACLAYNVRLVYISTDYLYEGDRGNYREDDPLKPFNLYAWSKLGGECSVVAVKNHLIIRTSFGKNTFDYKEAFTDKWSSKCYVDEIAPMILEAASSPLTGVLNLGTERKTLFDHASQRSEVKPVKIADTNYHTPYDTSLNLQKWMDYKSEKSIAKPHTKCRCCGSDKLVKYLDLGLMPLANNLEYTAKLAKEKDRFPLQVLFCEECYLSQLSVVIDPEVLFSYYTYRSGVSQGYIDHCKEMAWSLDGSYDIRGDRFHIDIAGNDGALLTEFRHILQHRVLNVDPASNLCSIAERNGIESICEFWSSDLAQSVLLTHGKADLITATNVFAHLDNIRDFMLGCKIILSLDGIIVIENPYLTEFIDNMEYCQTYFEHVSYLSLSPVMRLCDDLGLKVIDAIHVPIHSGSMRYIIAHDTSSHKVNRRVLDVYDFEAWNKYDDANTYLQYQSKVNAINTTFTNGLLALKKQGHSIVGFGSSAKGNTLLNYAGINTDIMDAILDDTPEKQGKFSPGTGIPIYARNYLKSHHVDYVAILAWNFSEEIINKLRDYGYEGKFIIPAPVYQIID